MSVCARANNNIIKSFAFVCCLSMSNKYSNRKSELASPKHGDPPIVPILMSSVVVVDAFFLFAISVIKEKSSKLERKKGRYGNENDFTLENWLFYLNFNFNLHKIISSRVFNTYFVCYSFVLAVAVCDGYLMNS